MAISIQSGYTALHYAASLDKPDFVKFLLIRGADTNAVTLEDGTAGNTPLHFACLFEKYKNAELLLSRGANPLIKNQYGVTPLQLLPASVVKSVKLKFNKLFQVCITFITLFTQYYTNVLIYVSILLNHFTFYVHHRQQ